MDFISDPKGWLRDAIVAPKKKLAFFAGAGISVDSGLPDFLSFSNNVVDSLCGPCLSPEDIDEISRGLRPEVLLQLVHQTYKDRSLEYYGSLECKFPNANHFFLALALRAGHCVFTTNVDTLIEQACNMIKFPCRPIVRDAAYKKALNAQSDGHSDTRFESQLFKLHGSIENKKGGLKKYESIRITLDRVGLGLTENQEQVLSECLRDRDFVFLGYSGNDHFSVHPVLRKVNSDQAVYWFKYEQGMTELECNQDTGYFQNRKKDLQDKASDGASTEVKWEDISIMEVLSRREHSILATGDSSYNIKESLSQAIHTSGDPALQKINDYLKNVPRVHYPGKVLFVPAWVKTITDYERHLMAANFLIRLRDLTSRTEDQLKQAESRARDDVERAEVGKLRASTLSITRRRDDIEPGKVGIAKAIGVFRSQGDFISEAEAYLELANVLRGERNFESAKETLDKAEDVLIKNKPGFQGQNRSYDWPRLMAQLYLYRGLVYGLGQRGTIGDKLKGIYYCDEARKYAYQAGDVARRASSLNSRGLIIYQLAERSGGLLQEAENSLDDAFDLYTRIGDPRASFQPLRNRVLIQRLRVIGSKCHVRDYWLREAQIDCNRARNFLSQVRTSGGEQIGDMAEIDYRQAQIFGMGGDKESARNLLLKVLEFYRRENKLHQQARVWQDLLSLADDWAAEQACIDSLLALIESMFLSDTERMSFKNDLLRLENVRDMLGDAYLKAYDHKHQGYLDRIVSLMDQGRKIAKEIGGEYLVRDFMIWSSGHPV